MRYAIFSDIHGNWEALSSVCEELDNGSVDAYLCGGDIVGYGADPTACLQRVQALGAICVAGNHDWAVSRKIPIKDFQAMAKEAILWTRQQLTLPQLTFLGDQPLIYENDDLVMVHGGLPDPGTFPYLYDLDMAKGMMPHLKKQVCFIGHTHVPQIICRQGDRVSYAGTLDLTLDPHCQYIVNVGSVGQSRDGDPEACLGLFDTESRRVTVRRIAYDLETAQAKILAAGLPKMLAVRLMLGM